MSIGQGRILYIVHRGIVIIYKKFILLSLYIYLPICGNCGDSYTGDEVAAMGHSFEAGSVPPHAERQHHQFYHCVHQ